MRKLTRNTTEVTAKLGVVGDEHTVKNSGDSCGEEFVNSSVPEAPLEARLHQDDLHVEALLLDHSIDAGVVHIDGNPRVLWS